MPLIVVVGYPSAGKTTWSTKLKQAFEDKINSLEPNEVGSNLKCILHTDESLGISHSMYNESITEKSARGLQISAVKRDISKNNIVILDTLNYIKGFRYQLHCESKQYSTTYCVIQIITPSEICFEWNSKRLDTENKWDENLLKALIMRFEEPNGQNRWDSPLIPISYDDLDLPFDDIWESIVLKKGSKPNHATLLKPAIGINFLQALDKLTSDVVNQIVQFQNLNNPIGGEILIKNGDYNQKQEEKLYVHMPSTSVSIAQLTRIRRTYVTLNRMRTVDNDRIIPLFVDYLNSNLNSD
ncbi:hypothetical protein CANARDRAFT_29884 [[Candida] arabinofermentans NRRL YB-2248]|uniref:Protein KTI12 n=1 Tax=[Candida] arabinofermentans NRRL YB-2248 TaxID=983967 RepID=A0A1E4SW30_9ASCO|nr:hypothetical protein CANARDRAFT_29884 [[Candida] arabinofermentans NRRL YB-2248]